MLPNNSERLSVAPRSFGGGAKRSGWPSRGLSAAIGPVQVDWKESHLTFFSAFIVIGEMLIYVYPKWVSYTLTPHAISGAQSQELISAPEFKLIRGKGPSRKRRITQLNESIFARSRFLPESRAGAHCWGEGCELPTDTSPRRAWCVALLFCAVLRVVQSFFPVPVPLSLSLAVFPRNCTKGGIVRNCFRDKTLSKLRRAAPSTYNELNNAWNSNNGDNQPILGYGCWPTTKMKVNILVALQPPFAAQKGL